METVEHLIVGAGPAGLRAAQLLAEAGREVLVLERQPEIGPKTCAGGLTPKSVRELGRLGLGPDAGLASVGHVAFHGATCRPMDRERGLVRTIPRRALGHLQLRWAEAAGAQVRAATAVTRLDLPARSLQAAGRRIGYRQIIGADGSSSTVRRALGLPSPRAIFAAEYNIPGVRLEPLRIECDSVALANGYFWVFPHATYTSVGAVAPKRTVLPAALRRYLDRRIAALGLSTDGVPFEGATLEVDFRGFHFSESVHLVGDAAGVASALTAEGIYAALLTGEEVARKILEPAYLEPRAARWLRVKRRHDRTAAALRSSRMRRIVLPGLAALAGWRPARGRLTDWFAAG